jgi:hypothetical protein
VQYSRYAVREAQKKLLCMLRKTGELFGSELARVQFGHYEADLRTAHS